MAIAIADDIYQAMLGHARRSFPCECCGLMIGRRCGQDATVEWVIPAENITTDDPTRNYQIDWQTLLTTTRQTRRDGDQLIGFFHSHTDGTGRPSRKDNEHAWVDRFYVIVPMGSTTSGDITCWRRSSETQPLEREPIVSV